MISVAACDLQPIVLEGLKAVLAQSEELEFVGGSENLEDTVGQLERHHPVILMVDRSFGMHGLLEWLGKTRLQFPDTEVIVWAASISDVECFRALQAGARGILRKNSSVPALFHCLKTVARKELWTENLFLTQDSPLGRSRSRPLTPREQQVAELVAKGMKNREIAEALTIATGTVKIHLMHIFEKTGIRDRFELALHGLRLACERAEKGTEKVPQKISGASEEAGAVVEQVKSSS
jgi:DNA-binding NarL/FixJ family response regulator